MMMPALFRPLDAAPVALSTQDWARLEPGRYMLACSGGESGSTVRWVGFERAESGDNRAETRQVLR